MPTTSQVVEKLYALPDRKCAEVEARLGTFKGKFDPDVGMSFFERTKSWLEESEYVKTCEPTQHHDYFYTYDGEDIRTRVIFNSSDMKIEKATICKHKLCHSIVMSEDSDVCFKLQLATETTRDIPETVIVEPHRVRIVSRYSYVVGPWRYDFSKVANGSTRLEAEDSKKNDVLTYEVECELIDLDYLSTRDANHVAKAFLCKMSDITLSSWKA